MSRGLASVGVLWLLSACHAEPQAVQVLLDGRFHCTGALVGAAAVLTARHCVAEDASVAVQLPGEVVPVEAVERGLGADEAGDVALLRLRRPVRGEALEVATTPVQAGARVSLVRATGVPVAARVTAADPGVLYTTPASCDGDSGAPLLLDGAIVGVASSRAFGTCGLGPSVFADVSAHRAWLAEVLADR